MAITHSEAEDILINHFLDNLPTVGGNQISQDIVMIPNAPFDNPTGLWLRVGINWDRATQLEAGWNGLDVTEGVFVFDLFCPQNEFSTVYQELQTQIIQLFNKKRLDNCIDIYSPYPVNLGQDKSWYHYQIQFTCRIVF